MALPTMINRKKSVERVRSWEPVLMLTTAARGAAGAVQRHPTSAVTIGGYGCSQAVARVMATSGSHDVLLPIAAPPAPMSSLALSGKVLCRLLRRARAWVVRSHSHGTDQRHEAVGMKREWEIGEARGAACA
jgi:hypothetical protein